jgi:hypothetical protein
MGRGIQGLTPPDRTHATQLPGVQIQLHLLDGLDVDSVPLEEPLMRPRWPFQAQDTLFESVEKGAEKPRGEMNEGGYRFLSATVSCRLPFQQAGVVKHLTSPGVNRDFAEYAPLWHTRVPWWHIPDLALSQAKTIHRSSPSRLPPVSRVTTKKHEASIPLVVGPSN